MKVAVIGSTGFLGEQICTVLSQLPEFEVKLLVANRNWKKLVQQAKTLHASSVYLTDSRARVHTASELTSSEITILNTKLDVREFVMGEEVDGVFFSLSGIDWIDLFYDLLVTKKTIWMATKEIIVAGSPLWEEKRELWHRKNVIALDSEHNALHQLLQNHIPEEIYKIFLTASGGAFYEWQGDLNEITPEMALSHPNWKMGPKITIDSANLINKGLEVIEANRLFGFPYSQIDVLIQRESTIHAMVEKRDGFILALLSKPDMKSVILHALQTEIPSQMVDYRLDFNRFKHLQFDYPVPKRFRGFYLAIEAGQLGGGYPALFCGADEACVQAFLNHRIKFNQIPIFLEKTLEMAINQPKSISDIVDLYQKGFMTVKNMIQQRRSLKC